MKEWWILLNSLAFRECYCFFKLIEEALNIAEGILTLKEFLCIFASLTALGACGWFKSRCFYYATQWFFFFKVLTHGPEKFCFLILKASKANSILQLIRWKCFRAFTVCMVGMDLVKVTQKVNFHWQDEIEVVFSCHRAVPDLNCQHRRVYPFSPEHYLKWGVSALNGFTVVYYFLFWCLIFLSHLLSYKGKTITQK